MFNNKVYHKIDALSGSVATLRAEGVKYNVYSSNRYPVDVADPANLVKTYLGVSYYEEYTPSIVYPRHYAVTAIDRYGNESRPLQWENTVVRRIERKKEACPP